MKPIVLYTNIFTLENTKFSDNKYIDMFYFWLHNVVYYAELQPSDIVIVMIDNATFDYMKTNHTLSLFISKLNINFCIYPQPKTLKEGMLNRYHIQHILNISKSIENDNPYYLYLDVDVLVIKNIRKIFSGIPENIPSSIFIKEESNIMDNNYLGEIISESDELIQLHKDHISKLQGVSSGIFAWTNSPNILNFFQQLLHKTENDHKQYYTIDQPFFNYTIINNLFKTNKEFNFLRFNNTYIAHNILGLHKDKNFVLVNLCGEPGRHDVHWNKIISQIIIQNIHPDK